MLDKFKRAAKSLSWLSNQFPYTENPEDDTDKLLNCIHLYSSNGSEAIKRMCNVLANAECCTSKDPIKQHNWITLDTKVSGSVTTEIRWCKNCGSIDIVHSTGNDDSLNMHNVTMSGISYVACKEVIE